MNSLIINDFIKTKITKRPDSFFKKDIEVNKKLISTEIKGKSLLVIGGAGSIGSAFIHEALKFKPARLYVFDINENGLTELTRDLRSAIDIKVPGEYKTYPINFGNKFFERILKHKGPFDIIANFAAHKHVRSEKDHYSVSALIENNILYADGLLQLLEKYPPKHFFCVSTDKAANPVNIMGASKSIMEELILSYATIFPITTARFANVAFSNGSLLDGFIYRMMKHQPLATPTDIRRFFVSPEEAGQICLLSCVLGKSGDIVFPKFSPDEMTSFFDITVDYLKLMGYEMQKCQSENEAKKLAALLSEESSHYPVYCFRSDTSGEKIYEEFFTDQEQPNFNLFTSLGVIENANSKSRGEVNQFIKKLKITLNQKSLSKSHIVKLLSEFLPDFHHLETGKSLDEKM
jgi:FlaA1/EpsC-like NDP-sugar epimerase